MHLRALIDSDGAARQRILAAALSCRPESAVVQTSSITDLWMEVFFSEMLRLENECTSGHPAHSLLPIISSRPSH